MPYGDRNRPREIFPATPFLFLQERGYELQWSTNSTFTWNTVAVTTSDFEYKTTKSKIFILTSGYYEIIYELSVYLYSGSMNYMYMGVYQNGNFMDGSRSYIHFPNSSPSCMIGHYYAYLNAGDYLQLYSIVGTGGGTIRTKADTVRFVIKFLPQKGWDNSHGGAENYRGGVDR